MVSFVKQTYTNLELISKYSWGLIPDYASIFENWSYECKIYPL